MRLGLNIGYSGGGIELPMQLVEEAERVGYDSVWTAEAYGSDAVVPLAWIGARTSRIRLGTSIMQMSARTPAMTAMTAMTLDALSGGRFILGIGPSGPQVVEGWHGVAYGKPLTRTREYVNILRQIFEREAPTTFQGEHYQLPYTGPGASGLGKPLKSILRSRPDIPIYTAAISPNGVACSAEVADGLIPVWMDPGKFDLLLPALEKGFKKAGDGKSLETFDVAPFVAVVLGDDVDRCRSAIKPMLALYIGGMGARSKNFYNDYATRLGFGEAARRIQDLYLDGKKMEATALVPDELVDAIALCGPRDRIADRFQRWKGSPVGTMILGTGQAEAVRLLAELAL
jgi:F420-dependent oxidoreductase-like protein